VMDLWRAEASIDRLTGRGDAELRGK
jgi:hypothetical protein